MKRLGISLRWTFVRHALTAAIIIGISACGGGGGSGGGTTGGGTGVSNTITATNTNGSTKIEVGTLELRSDGSSRSRTSFSVTLRTASGGVVVGGVTLSAGSGLVILSPQGGQGQTDGNGVLSGEIEAVAGGSFALRAQPALSTGLPAVSINIVVFGAPPPTSTATVGTFGPNPTSTPTVVPVIDVTRLVVQANPFVIKSALGGQLTITVIAFDMNNLAVPGVRLLLDAAPRNGVTFDPNTPITNNSGIAVAAMNVEPGAAVGEIIVSAFAGANVEGRIAVRVVSGVSSRPVTTVVLESDQPVIGTDSGGTASLRARAFDADNIGIPDVNVLFKTEVGQVSPSTEVSCGNLRPCPPSDVGLAQTTLTVPPNAVAREYRLEAQAGGVTGTTTISVVLGRGGVGTGNPNAAAGEPASISLGASPTAVFARGTGGVEQATIITRVYDNNNNPLSAAVVAVRVIPDSADGAQMLPLSGLEPNPPQECLNLPGWQQAFDEGRVAIGVTDRAGFMLASMRAGLIKGTITIAACARSQNRDMTFSTVYAQQPIVTVTAGPPAIVTLAVNSRFINNNDGTLLTTIAALVKDVNGNTVEDNTAVDFSVTNRQDVSVIGASTTNNLPTCDIDQFPGQTGLPVTNQPGTAMSCIVYPEAQAGTIVALRASSGGVSNEDNEVEDEEFNLPPGSVTGPATGVPSARNFSLASSVLNLSGRVTFGLQSTITAFVADRFGNPVKRTVTVSFSTDGGGVTSQGLTSLVGRATGVLTTQGPIPADGRVTVTASVEGEEDFEDLNGNGQFDDGVDVFDAGLHDQDGDGEFSPNTTIRTSMQVIFSAPTTIDVEPSEFDLLPGERQCLTVAVSDIFGNPIVGGSTVSAVVTTGLTLLGPPSVVVPDSSLPCDQGLGACLFSFCVFPTDIVQNITFAGVTFTVSSAGQAGGGNGGAVISATGRIFPPEPEPTPEPTPEP